ncbi:MAG: hypothetical protein ACXADW_08245 [Candidatus Hodarchaeales archaeon]|jgi:hypothetical protein
MMMSRLIFDSPGVVDLADPEVDSYQIHDSTLTIFKQSECGPTGMGDDYLPFVSEDSDPESTLYRIASYFGVAIGQGSYYHTGLFGPLPVIGSNYQAMIFTAIVKDNKTFDERMKGWNYLMACFFFHKSLLSVINEKRELIEVLIESFFDKHNHLNTITDRAIQGLKKVILSVILD